MEPIGKNLDLIANVTARSMAAARKLVGRDGTVYCWNCTAMQRRTPELEAGVASLPSLHCDGCLALHARRQEEAPYTRRVVNGIEYEYPTDSDEERRWRSMIHNMQHEQRLDRESASRLLSNAKALPGAFDGNIAELTDAFLRRFGHEDAPRSSRPLRYRDEAAE